MRCSRRSAIIAGLLWGKASGRVGCGVDDSEGQPLVTQLLHLGDFGGYKIGR